MNVMTKLRAGTASILGRLPRLSSSAEFAAALPEIDDELQTAEERLAKLEAKREEAIFTSPDALAALADDIAAANEAIKTLHIARDGADRRRQEAAEREEIAALERRMAEAATDNAELTAAYREFDTAASRIAALAPHIRALKARVDHANSLASAHGRRDLRVRTILQSFIEYVDEARGRGEKVRSLAGDPAGKELHITGYFPDPAGFSDFLKSHA